MAADCNVQHAMLQAYADDNQYSTFIVKCQREDAQSAVFDIQHRVSEDGLQPTHTQHGQDRADVDGHVSQIPVCCRSLALCGAAVIASDAVRVLVLTPDLSLDKHVTAVNAISAILSATTTAPHPTLSRRALSRYSRPCVRC